MNVPRIIDAMNYVDDRYISGSIEYRRSVKKKINLWKYIAVAAYIVLILTAGVAGGWLLDFEADPNFMFPNTSFCETSDAYYGIVPSDAGNRIMYYAKSNGAHGILCAKVGCNHDSSDCNALVYPTASGISAYDGRLYWAARDMDNDLVMSIFSLRLDGTDRQVVKVIPEEELDGLNGSVYVKVHRGYMYFAGASYDDGMIRVTAEELSRHGDRITLLERAGDNIKMQMSGNKITMLIHSTVIGENGIRKNTVEVYEWNTATRVFTGIFSGEVPINVFDMRLDGEIVYLTGSDPEKKSIPSAVYCLDINSREFSLKFDFSDVSEGFGCPYLSDGKVTAMSADNSLVCVKDYDGNGVIYNDMSIFDNELKFVIEAIDADFTLSRRYIGANDKYLFFDYCDGRYLVAVPTDGREPIYLWNSRH